MIPEPVPEAMKPVVAALEALLPVFPERLEKARLLTMYDRDPEDRPDWDAFEAFVRAHKTSRLTMPALALLRWQHRLVRDSLRRFAYFVPSLLAGCIGDESSISWSAVTSLARDAHSAEEIYHPGAERHFTDEERDAMRDFFVLALEREVHGPSPLQALALLECAAWLEAHPVEIALAWVGLDDVDAERALVAAVDEALSWNLYERAREALLTERVRAALEARCLAATDPARATALSEAEAAIAALLPWPTPA